MGDLQNRFQKVRISQKCRISKAIHGDLYVPHACNQLKTWQWYFKTKGCLGDVEGKGCLKPTEACSGARYGSRLSD